MSADGDGEDTPEARTLVGERIREARKACGIATAADLADAVGVRQNTLYRYERGELVPSVWVLYRIARETGVRMEWLVSGDSRPEDTAVLEAWLQTPLGQTAPAEAVAFLRALPLSGYVAGSLFYDLALTAWRAGLTADEAARAARTTRRFR
jgi:transcriptional regulator with XRE-family HTH domain